MGAERTVGASVLELLGAMYTFKPAVLEYLVKCTRLACRYHRATPSSGLISTNSAVSSECANRQRRLLASEWGSHYQVAGRPLAGWGHEW